MRRALVIGCFVVAFSSFATAQTISGDARSPLVKTQQKTPPTVTFSPDNLYFDKQVIKRTSKPKRITVTNIGETNLYINSAAIGGDNWQDFTLLRDTCTGATLDMNKSCIIDISFTPTDTGNRKAKMTLTDNAADSPQEVPLSGEGINSVDVPPTRSGQAN